MAPTEKEIQKELKIVLREIGEIKPWYDKDFSTWIFEHPLYPVSYSGDSPQEVIEGYPQYIREFVYHRMIGRLNALVEKETKGCGG